MGALVAELVDAADSKSAVHTDVRVRVSPRAPTLRTSVGLLQKNLEFHKKCGKSVTKLQHLTN